MDKIGRIINEINPTGTVSLSAKLVKEKCRLEAAIMKANSEQLQEDFSYAFNSVTMAIQSYKHGIR